MVGADSYASIGFKIKHPKHRVAGSNLAIPDPDRPGDHRAPWSSRFEVEQRRALIILAGDGPADGPEAEMACQLGLSGEAFVWAGEGR